MGDFSFDPSTGQQGTSLPVPGGGRPAWGGPDNPWTPNAFPIDPHEDPYGEAASVTGLPPNVVAGEVDGAPDGIHATATVDVTDDFAASKVQGEVPGNIVTRSADDLDGDDDPHDQDSCDPEDCGDDCDDTGFVADNIVTSDATRGHCGPRTLGPNPNVVLPDRSRPRQ